MTLSALTCSMPPPAGGGSKGTSNVLLMVPLPWPSLPRKLENPSLVESSPLVHSLAAEPAEGPSKFSPSNRTPTQQSYTSFEGLGVPKEGVGVPCLEGSAVTKDGLGVLTEGPGVAAEGFGVA